MSKPKETTTKNVMKCNGKCTKCEFEYCIHEDEVSHYERYQDYYKDYYEKNKAYYKEYYKKYYQKNKEKYEAARLKRKAKSVGLCI